MCLEEDILERNCNTDCPRYVAGTCPFPPSEKKDCPRVKEYIHAIYDLAIPEDSGMTAKEFLEDERLSYLTWKNIVKFRFDDISFEAFENVIKIVGKIDD